MYDADELSDARADYADAFLVQEGFRLIGEPTVSSLGGVGVNFVSSRTSSRCRIRPQRKQQEAQVANQTQAQSLLEIEFEIGTVVTPKDQWSINKVTYDVIGTDDGRPEALCLVAQVVKIG